MDFRTEWSSWLMILLMMVMCYFTYPYHGSGNIGALALQVVGIPLGAIALASLPVIVYCYIVKLIPDIDYSIRLAFIFILFKFIQYNFF